MCPQGILAKAVTSRVILSKQISALAPGSLTVFGQSHFVAAHPVGSHLGPVVLYFGAQALVKRRSRKPHGYGGDLVSAEAALTHPSKARACSPRVSVTPRNCQGSSGALRHGAIPRAQRELIRARIRQLAGHQSQNIGL